LNIKEACFIVSAAKFNQYPAGSMPEIAFAGRSNVGKSSLINVLVNRKNLVRTSSTPGRTQLINFFQVNNQFMLVDLPGFGFAKVPLAVKKQWGPMVETYLSKRENLKVVVLLVDIRRTPGEEEQQLMSWLTAYSIPVLVVATKCDKVSKNEKARQAALIAQHMGLAKSDLHFFSSLTKEGKESLWKTIVMLHPDLVGESAGIAKG